jgi:hypothetical protein
MFHVRAPPQDGIRCLGIADYLAFRTADTVTSHAFVISWYEIANCFPNHDDSKRLNCLIRTRAVTFSDSWNSFRLESILITRADLER